MKIQYVTTLILVVSMFESVVAIVFQSIFHLEMHQNNIFFIY
jgi:hypothetical protein